MAAEMRDQMAPSAKAMGELKAAVEGKRAMLSEVEHEIAEQTKKVEEQKSQNAQAAAARGEVSALGLRAEHEENLGRFQNRLCELLKINEKQS